MFNSDLIDPLEYVDVEYEEIPNSTGDTKDVSFSQIKQKLHQQMMV